MSDIVVHQIPGAWGLPSTSPFCLKLETCLIMAGIPYRTVIDATPFKGPKKKLPWIEHKGLSMGDSNFILEYLAEEFGCHLNADLSDQERAVSRSMKRLMEENLYWVMVYDRWMVEKNWNLFRDVVLQGIPRPVRYLFAPIARRGVGRQLKGHGMGLHSKAEIHSIGMKDIGAIADFLGGKKFLMGDSPTEIDAVAYGLLANIMQAPIESPVKDEGLKRANLLAFLATMRNRYYL